MAGKRCGGGDKWVGREACLGSLWEPFGDELDGAEAERPDELFLEQPFRFLPNELSQQRRCQNVSAGRIVSGGGACARIRLISAQALASDTETGERVIRGTAAAAAAPTTAAAAATATAAAAAHGCSRGDGLRLCGGDGCGGVRSGLCGVRSLSLREQTPEPPERLRAC